MICLIKWNKLQTKQANILLEQSASTGTIIMEGNFDLPNNNNFTKVFLPNFLKLFYINMSFPSHNANFEVASYP